MVEIPPNIATELRMQLGSKTEFWNQNGNATESQMQVSFPKGPWDLNIVNMRLIEYGNL
jgi:hypothetical protein